MANITVNGLEEAGYSIDQFKTTTGEYRVPVSVESQEETPMYAAGNAIVADEDMGQELEERLKESGNRAWKDDFVGHVVMRSPEDEGKKVWIKSQLTSKWIGPLVVVRSIPSDSYYQWVNEDIVIAVGSKIGREIGLMERGGAAKK